MKDAEDEAFEELAKRQGMWGGGFQAKRAAAADKLQEPAQSKTMDKDEALKLALEALKHMCEHTRAKVGYKGTFVGKAIAAIKAALAQPAHSEWNAALDEAAARINNIRGFGQATQDSFAVFIKGLKK